MSHKALKRVLCSLLAMGVLVGSCCKKAVPDKSSSIDSTHTRHGRTKITVGNIPLWVEIADNPETRTQGLMFRRSLPADEGMLFVFEYSEPQSFWMKNTYLPLDIAFVSPDYRILNILPMKPLDEKPRYKSAGAALYAIEVNQGWFGQNGIKAGDSVRFR